MINFADVKSKIAKIAGVEADAVAIGFTKRTYEVTIEGAELDRIAVAKIVDVLGDAVVKTVRFVDASEDSVIVVFDMNM